MRKFVIAVCAVFAMIALAACGGSASSGASTSSASANSSAAAENLQDYGWIAFEMPEGWADAKESDKYETIAESANNKHMMKFMLNTLTASYPTAADKAATDIASETNHYSDAGKQVIGNFEWSLASFEFNGNPSVVAYADAADGKCLKVTIYELGIDDPAVQVVLSSIKVNPDELW